MATHHICDDPGATDDWKLRGGHPWSDEVKIRVFANNLRQDGNRDGVRQRQTDSQATSKDMHIDLLQS